METTKGATKRADAVTNRTRILEAARQVFTERGLDLEMQEVATQAHLGVGTIYGHFANREDLLRAIVRSIVEGVLAQLRTALASHPNDPRAALQALVAAGLQVQYRYRPLFAVIRDPRLVRLLDPSYGQSVRMQFLEIPKALLSQGVQTGIFRRDLDQDIASVMIMGTFNSAIDLLGTDRTLDELTQQLNKFLQTFLTEQAETKAIGNR